MSTATLHVVTHRRWVADDFADAGVPVRHSLGFDLPDFALGDSVWAPMEWMHRAANAQAAARPDGPWLDLTDPGARFLTRFPETVTGRRVELLTLAELIKISDAVHDGRPVTDDGPLVFAKPANCKIEDFPARWDDYEGHVLRAIAAQVPPDQPFLVTKTRLDLAEEHRLWILNGEVVTSSVYLQHGAADGQPVWDGEKTTAQTTWHPDMRATRDDTQAVEAFGHRVLAELVEHDTQWGGGTLPRAFTLDVGLLTDGRLVVIEANPAWSSALYGARPERVAECVAASSRLVDTMALSDPWRWAPDPYLRTRAGQQRPLGSTSTPAPHTAGA